MRLRTWVVAGLVLMTLAGQGNAVLKPASLFQDNMVLQQGIKVPLWGQAEPGEDVRVTFGRQTARARADSNGCWKAVLKSLNASAEPQSLTIAAGTNTVTVTNVVVGEVWICSGQSNMEWPVGSVLNAEREMAGADYPSIRMFTVGKAPMPTPQRACGGGWRVCSPQTAAGFSAVGYFFARTLHLDMKVPVGMINASWGGTAAEPWTAIEELRQLPFMEERMAAYDKVLADYMADIETFKRKQAEAQQAYETAKAGWQKHNAESDLGTKERWFDPATRVEGWKEFSLPMPVGNNVLSNFTGWIWARKDVEIPEAWVGKDLLLHLGPVDDYDITYVNGEQVGKSPVDLWNSPRQYKVPAALNKTTKVTVVIKVENLVGAIGLYGAEKEHWLKPEGAGEEKPVVLTGPWFYNQGLAIDLKTMPRSPSLGLPGTSAGEPATLFNSMIAPLTPYALRGAIWYQGESNAGRPGEYGSLLPAMIDSWRRVWGQGDFPFGIVQLANYRPRQQAPIEAQSWADLRDSQTATLKVRNTGMAVIIDIGDAVDIHPRNKQDVGRRLGLWALSEVYGRRCVYSGPLYRKMKVKQNQVILRFDHVGGGLMAKGESLTGFAVAGEDKVFHVAQATIDGATIVVSSDKVTTPVAVRYAWANNPVCNLFNKEGLPASPFRTDDWEREDVKAAEGESVEVTPPAAP